MWEADWVAEKGKQVLVLQDTQEMNDKSQSPAENCQHEISSLIS